jgi:hypothetical protein
MLAGYVGDCVWEDPKAQLGGRCISGLVLYQRHSLASENHSVIAAEMFVITRPSDFRAFSGY